MSPVEVLICIIPILSPAAEPKSLGFPLGSAAEPLTLTTYCLGVIDVASSAVSSSLVNDHLFALSSYPRAVPTPFAPVVTIIPPSPLVEPLASCKNLSATLTFEDSIVVNEPTTSRLPVIVKLSLMVTSDVVCPIEIGTPLFAVPIEICVPASMIIVESESNQCGPPLADTEPLKNNVSHFFDSLPKLNSSLFAGI